MRAVRINKSKDNSARALPLWACASRSNESKRVPLSACAGVCRTRTYVWESTEHLGLCTRTPHARACSRCRLPTACNNASEHAWKIHELHACLKHAAFQQQARLRRQWRSGVCVCLNTYEHGCQGRCYLKLVYVAEVRFGDASTHELPATSLKHEQLKCVCGCVSTRACAYPARVDRAKLL
eukprot:2330074-Pleurochrysis_carterae.AAC.1